MNRSAMEYINGHRGIIVWFTGLSGAGKTTLSEQVQQQLHEQGVRSVILDGDRLRAGLNRDLGFSEKDREESMRRAAEVAAMFLEAGFVVLVPIISPSSTVRDQVRQRFKQEDYAEAYIRCSLTECEQRDPKGLYQLARSGQIKQFTGIDAPYEPPLTPEVIIDTEHQTIKQCTTQLVNYICGACMTAAKKGGVQ